MMSAQRGENSTGMATGLNRKPSHKVRDLPVAPHTQGQAAESLQINSLSNEIGDGGIKSFSEVQAGAHGNLIEGSSLLTPRIGQNLMT